VYFVFSGMLKVILNVANYFLGVTPVTKKFRLPSE